MKMRTNAIASLAAALLVSVGLPALARTNLRIVNATTHDITVTHGDGNSVQLPPQHVAPRHLPIFILTSQSEAGGLVSFGVYDSGEKCTTGDTEGWDIRALALETEKKQSTLSHFCIRLGFAEVGCLLAEVHPERIAFSKVADTECTGAE